MKAVNHFEQGYIDTAEPLGVRGATIDWHCNL